MADIHHDFLVATLSIAGLLTVSCGGADKRAGYPVGDGASSAPASASAAHETSTYESAQEAIATESGISCATLAARRLGVNIGDAWPPPTPRIGGCTLAADALVTKRTNVLCREAEPVAGVVARNGRVTQLMFYSPLDAPTCLARALADWSSATERQHVEELRPDGQLIGYRAARDDLGVILYRLPVGGAWKTVAVVSP